MMLSPFRSTLWLSLCACAAMSCTDGSEPLPNLGAGVSGADPDRSTRVVVPGPSSPDGDPLIAPEPEPTPAENLHLFNPASYAGYDPTGATESSAAFQAAIDDASAYAALHQGDAVAAGLYTPTALTNAEGVNVGPTTPQAVVRTDAAGAFLLTRIAMRSGVRLEIDASSTLIPVETVQQVVLQGWPTGSDSSEYLHDVTITAHGTSATFRDTGRRCTAAALSSPCSLPKSLRYPDATFPDGSHLTGSDPTSIDHRFTIDLDYRRYPSSDKAIGNAPRGSGIKLLAIKRFLVERMLELAHPGEVRDTTDTPPGPGAIGSNTWPATAGNGLAVGALPGPADLTAEAIQARNGTMRYLHCEDCTRGYGIAEIHAGVDLEYRYMSTRGGIAVRWESAGNGRSTRQTARQVVGFDCNVPLLMSTHDRQQESLRGSFVKGVGCDAGFRSESAGGSNTGSSVSDFFIHAGGIDGDPGARAQVIVCRGGKDRTGCAKLGVPVYDDDAWLWKVASAALKNDNAIPTSRMYCDEADFVASNSGGSCAVFP
jgi:hypothetical protein